jgi:aryl-alcohol dehydrogenase-like predicted oxidoreductase
MTFGNQADTSESFRILDTAWDAGVRFIDTADVYPLGGGLERVGATESIIGQWLPRHRSETILATKCFGPMADSPHDRGLSRKHILDAVEQSLQRLRTDYIDLYQAHQFDIETPMDETLRAFEFLVTSGKVRYIGVSNWRAWHLAKALGIASQLHLTPIISVQPRYNLLFRMIEDELVPLCMSEGVGIIPYNPLAGGMLTGRYQPGQSVAQDTRFGLANAGPMYQERYWQAATFTVVEQYRQWCQEHDKDMTTTAVQWVIQQPGITSAILGASTAEQLQKTLVAADRPPLSADDLTELDQLWFSLPRRREAR